MPMHPIVERIVKHAYTTISGLAIAATIGAADAFMTGQVSKEALLFGAAAGIIGAALKDPKWIERIKAAREGKAN